MSETASIFYPYTLYPEVGTWTRETINSTVLEKSFTGIEQRLSAYPDPGYERFSFRTIPIKPGIRFKDGDVSQPWTGDQCGDFLYFLSVVRGRAGTFYFLPYDFEFYLRIPIATLAGGESFTPVPYRFRAQDVKATISGPLTGLGLTEVKVAGATQVYGSDYAAYNGNLNGDLPYSAGTIQWLGGGGAPAGALVATFFGAKRVICRLDIDNPPRQVWASATQPNFLQWQLSFLEVR